VLYSSILQGEQVEIVLQKDLVARARYSLSNLHDGLFKKHAVAAFRHFADGVGGVEGRRAKRLL
jgi:hypothetical protein